MESNEKRTYYLHAMGIEQWVLQNNSDEKPMHTSNPIETQDSRATHIAQMDWETLEKTVKECRACSLYQTRTQGVFGVGHHNANLFIIGEAPGANEDKQGEPFVGRAGKLLNAMLASIQLDRKDIYIANILKSRPPGNRDPLAEEVAACTPYLLRQITLLRPKVLLAVGRIAAQFLLNTTQAMRQLRGETFEYGPLKTPLLVTYHPAYLLRAPREKRKAWQDIQRLYQLLNA